MKVYLHTWRYGIESTQFYHGLLAKYDPDTGCLTMVDTVWDVEPDVEAAFRHADFTIVTHVAGGDEFSVVRCNADSDNCHPDDKDSDSQILVISSYEG